MQDGTPQLHSWQVLWDKLPAGATCLVRNRDYGTWTAGIGIENAEEAYGGWELCGTGFWKNVSNVENVLIVSPARFSQALIVWRPGHGPSPSPQSSSPQTRESWFNGLKVGDRVYAQWDSHEGNGEITAVDPGRLASYRYKVLIDGKKGPLWIKNDEIEPPRPETTQSAIVQDLSELESLVSRQRRLLQGL